MEEDENVSSVQWMENATKVWIKNRLVSLFGTNRFRIGSILQGIAYKTIAFIAIASHTLSVAHASSQSSSNDLDAIVASDVDSDYFNPTFDSIGKRIYRNLSVNTAILKSLQNVSENGSNINTTGISDSDSGENVTMTSLGSNLLVAAVTSTLNFVKSNESNVMVHANNFSSITEIDVESTPSPMIDDENNYWALSSIILVVGTAAGNILVCLAIAWERRLQNVTNYFLMSLAITDLMVAILVMPFGILTLVKGEYKVIHLFFYTKKNFNLFFLSLKLIFLNSEENHLKFFNGSH